MYDSNDKLNISSRVKKECSFEDCFPVACCPECKRANTPFGVSTMSNPDEITTYYYCLNCGYSTIAKPKIVGYVSVVDLENFGWDSEL